MSYRYAMTNADGTHPAASMITIQGQINPLTERLLLEAYQEASQPAVLLNCTGLDSFNSTVIHLLIKLLIRARHQQQRLLAFGLCEHSRYILELTRLHELIDVYESEAEATAALS